jgi:tetratricopeptide (TPR) repeat protein
MDAQGDSEDVVQVEASGRGESKIVAAAQVRSIDYQGIIEDTVAGLIGNTHDERRKIYAHARSVFLHRLWLMELPETTVEIEKLALDLAIGKVERRWGAQDAGGKSVAEKLAAEKATSFDVPEPGPEPSAAPMVPTAGVWRRLAIQIGAAVALPAIAATIFFSLNMHGNVTYRRVAGDLVERLLVHPGDEPRVTARARDVLADHGSTRAARIPAAPAAGPRVPATATMTAACGRRSVMSERDACSGSVSGRGMTAEIPKTENDALWREDLSPFSDMTWGAGPANALNGPVVAAEDFAIDGAITYGYGAPAPDAALMSSDAAPHAAAPQAPRPPVMKPITPKVAALLASGRQATLKGDLDRAVHDFGEAIRIDPKYPDSYLERGQTFFKLGETERAIADYSAALAHDPQHGAALRARGMAQLYLGKNDLALADLSKAIELGEHDSQTLMPIELFYARRSRGAIYEIKQQYDLEIADCTALIESYAHDPMLVEALAANYGSAGAANILARLYRQRATAFARRSSVERAVADLTQAIPLSSDRGYAALIDRSKLHEGLGRHDLAAADARAALNIRPGSEEARLALSRLSALSSPPPGNGL